MAGDGVTSLNMGSISWKPLTDNEPSLAVSFMALDPIDNSGNTLWVGAGSQSSGGSGNGGPAVGLLKTTDGGQTWTHLVGTAATSISDASDATPIVVTTTNTANLSNGSQVTISGAKGNTAANGTWTISNVTPTGFTLASDDNGDVSKGNGIHRRSATWATSINQFKINCVVPTRITDPTTGKQVVLIGTQWNGLLRSNDGGANFVPVSYGVSPSKILHTGSSVMSMVADPTDENRFYAALNGVGVFESLDGAPTGSRSITAILRSRDARTGSSWRRRWTATTQTSSSSPRRPHRQDTKPSTPPIFSRALAGRGNSPVSHGGLVASHRAAGRPQQPGGRRVRPLLRPRRP